jgi:hypothetical protein
MAAIFHTRLLVAPVGNGRLWITESPFVVESEIAGMIEVPAGFLFNGNSVPRVTWFVSPPSDYLEAGCVHDFLYAYGDDRKLADQVYREILELQGMSKARRNFRYAVLRLFGRRPSKREAGAQ